MPANKDTKKVNPLFMSTSKRTETDQEPITEEQEEPVPTPLPSAQVKHRAKRNVSFEEAYKRETVYIDRVLNAAFEQLLESSGKTKTELVNEAIGDLLRKHNVQ